MNSPILCLTRDDPRYSHDRQVRDLIAGGARFVQLRSKTIPIEELHQQANKALGYAKSCDAILIINDNIELARKVDADGVHLGTKDGTVASARKILSSNKIVGKTVHSIKEAKLVKSESPDYVGLGPYRASSTKKELRPVLSDQQFLSIVEILDPIPVYLIGGLSTDDFPLIESLNLYGLALCSALFSGNCLEKQIKLVIEKSSTFPCLVNC